MDRNMKILNGGSDRIKQRSPSIDGPGRSARGLLRFQKAYPLRDLVEKNNRKRTYRYDCKECFILIKV